MSGGVRILQPEMEDGRLMTGKVAGMMDGNDMMMHGGDHPGAWDDWSWAPRWSQDDAEWQWQWSGEHRRDSGAEWSNHSWSDRTRADTYEWQKDDGSDLRGQKVGSEEGSGSAGSGSGAKGDGKKIAGKEVLPSFDGSTPLRDYRHRGLVFSNPRKNSEQGGSLRS